MSKFRAMLGPLHERLWRRTPKREDRYEIAPEAIREAIVNAVVHREYLMTSASIMIRIFNDRIEVESPGSSLGFDAEHPDSGRSVIRNQGIAAVFKTIGFIERYGTGIPRMMESCIANGNRAPQFSDDGQWFKVILYRPAVAIKYQGTRADQILDAIKTNPSMMQKGISEVTGIPIASVKRIVEDLRSKGIIERNGGRSGEWIVHSNLVHDTERGS